jgi:hypothetical protein
VTWDARVLLDVRDVRQTGVVGNAWEEDLASVIARSRTSTQGARAGAGVR